MDDLFCDQDMFQGVIFESCNLQPLQGFNLLHSLLFIISLFKISAKTSSRRRWLRVIF